VRSRIALDDGFEVPPDSLLKVPRFVEGFTHEIPDRHCRKVRVSEFAGQVEGKCVL
jgi:hypothetical protein